MVANGSEPNSTLYMRERGRSHSLSLAPTELHWSSVVAQIAARIAENSHNTDEPGARENDALLGWNIPQTYCCTKQAAVQF